jgi:hypothetical protein
MVPRVAVALVLAMSVAVRAQRGPGPGGPFPNVGPPLLLRLEGLVEPSAAEARGKGFSVVSLGLAGTDERRWFAVTKARTVGGDQPLDGKDVIALVAPFQPNFLAAGPEPLVDQLRNAAPGTRITIEGLVDRGSRTYYLRRVEPDAEQGGR